MAAILCIETATNLCSVALGIDNKPISCRESFAKNTHSESLALFINEVLSDAGITFSDLDAIAVGAGPGSYTGLRIGVSTAKGLCYALEKPLISISSLKTLSSGLIMEYRTGIYNQDQVLFCPMIDARRMEVYSAIFNNKGGLLRNVFAEIITEYSFHDYLKKHVMVFGGDGSVKCKNVIDSNNTIFSEIMHPSALFMLSDAFTAYEQEEFADVAYFEPFYLKDFIAAKPQVKGLI